MSNPTSTARIPKYEGATEPAGESERPLPPRPHPREPLWIAFNNMTLTVGMLNERVGKLEPAIEEARAAAGEAITKVDAIAHSQVTTQRAFAKALDDQTNALRTFGAALEGVKTTGRWMIGLLALMVFSLILLSVVVGLIYVR